MKKKNLVACLFIMLGFTAFLLWAISISFKIGNNLKDISIYLQYFYYLVALIVIYFLLIRPFFIVMFSPAFSLERITKDLEGKQKKFVVEKNYKNLRKLAHRLIKKKLVNEENVDLLKIELKKSEGSLIEKYTNIKLLIDKCIEKDLKKDLKNIVIMASRDTLYLTSISQNSFIDILIVVINNFRLLKKIVIRCGFRPSFVRLFKFYINVSFSALIADGAQKMDVNSIFGSALKGIAKPVVGSLLDGTVNAFFMLRTGFLARNYILEECDDEDSKSNARRSAFIDASAALPELSLHTIIAPVTQMIMGGVVNPTKKAVKELFGKKEELVIEGE